MAKTVAFLGLGHMGAPMATNLIKAGFKVNGFDPVTELLNAAAAKGIGKCSSPQEAVNNADFVVSMLPNGAAVECLYIDTDKLLDDISYKSLIIDCSTISAASSKRLIHDAKIKGLHAIEAPVSGGVSGAEKGSLSFICGGASSDVDKAKEVLEPMSSNIFYAGSAGAGQTAKICNNMLLAIHMIGTAEALQLGADNGLDTKVLTDIISKSSGCNWSVQNYNPYPGVMPEAPASNNYAGGFMVKLMCKDLGLAQETASQSKSYTPLGSLARNLYGILNLRGGSDLDFSSIQKLFQEAD
ncbi:3-hydroxyisobutyrate dehydrogenase [Microbulbifer sp. OS29]|uniref:3-hydroxyisobutyrate dehydrogenase n=2 Tax=Microbulbifer okhotskensis TaxID=2926617 RepID=A0A9X2J7Y5_9GAMM|nr:3-hydroxyisobutyrate dehydrogenase [Microbulbifer okhotskensis]MCO1336285.1 3-hydroxyisobutyrate dehydrogenase [Microbulbifer okhotskensis]